MGLPTGDDWGRLGADHRTLHRIPPERLFGRSMVGQDGLSPLGRVTWVGVPYLLQWLGWVRDPKGEKQLGETEVL